MTEMTEMTDVNVGGQQAPTGGQGFAGQAWGDPRMAPPAWVPQFAPVAPVAQPDRMGEAVAGLVLGIVSVVLWISPLIGLTVSILGIVFSRLGRKSPARRTMATWGLGLSITGLALSLILLTLVVVGLLVALSVPSAK